MQIHQSLLLAEKHRGLDQFFFVSWIQARKVSPRNVIQCYVNETRPTIVLFLSTSSTRLRQLLENEEWRWRTIREGDEGKKDTLDTLFDNEESNWPPFSDDCVGEMISLRRISRSDACSEHRHGTYFRELRWRNVEHRDPNPDVTFPSMVWHAWPMHWIKSILIFVTVKRAVQISTSDREQDRYAVMSWLRWSAHWRPDHWLRWPRWVASFVAWSLDHRAQREPNETMKRSVWEKSMAKTNIDGEQTRHAIEIILIACQLDHFGNDRVLSPIAAKLLYQFFQIVRGCFANGEDVICQPTHAETAEFLIEELRTLKRECSRVDWAT